MCSKTQCRGFTIVELMVTLAVIALVAMIGVPSLKKLLENNRVSAQTNRLVSSIHLARSEAVKRNGGVTLCPLGNPASPVCGRQWQRGWKVVAGDEVLEVVALEDRLLSVPSAPLALNFDGEGRVVGRVERKIVIEKASFQRQVLVRASGSVKSCRLDKHGDCIER